MNHAPLIVAMSEYEAGNVAGVNHFLKVFAFAKAIGEGEGFSPELQELTETAALVHDIGIKPSMEKYGSAAGEYQEKEGPDIAREMLTDLGYPAGMVERVCFLVGHHHTYSHIDGPDYQALVEADFLVNIFEGQMKRPEIEAVRKNIFRTKTGKKLLDTLFLREKKA